MTSWRRSRKSNFSYHFYAVKCHFLPVKQDTSPLRFYVSHLSSRLEGKVQIRVFSASWKPLFLSLLISALVAEGYAAKCIWSHNPALDDTGENLFVSSGPLDLRDALEKWFLEHLNFDYQNNSCDEDKMCGHYTQMVWGDTHRVGCAFHLCNTMELLDWERVSFLVCNYFPASVLTHTHTHEEEVTVGSSDPPPAASPSSTFTAAPAATTPRAPNTPSMTPTARSAADSPPPGTAEQEVFFSPTSRAPQEEEEAGKSNEKEREERVIRKQEIWQKTFPQSNISAGSGSVSAALVLLAGLAGLLTLWL
uniref:SCP domain-containing protein n=1 Tax=Xiphophorus couchianus TaxID=32473 RepID=A0A3B5ME90_9TELE